MNYHKLNKKALKTLSKCLKNYLETNKNYEIKIENIE